MTDERGIYGAKLLADLGADVVRPEPPEGDPLRQRGPWLQTSIDDQDRSVATSLWHAVFASNRRFFKVDLDTTEGRNQLQQLLLHTDIVLTCDRTFAVEQANLKPLQTQRPELVVVDVSSFGHDGPWADYLALDLVAGALGGAAATTGDMIRHR